MTNTAETNSCIMVGAGISGLVAACELSDAGWRVVVLDEGSGVGGRMATRRLGDGTFDHGAQFFTVQSGRFGRVVAGWLEAVAGRAGAPRSPPARGRLQPNRDPHPAEPGGANTAPTHRAPQG